MFLLTGPTTPLIKAPITDKNDNDERVNKSLSGMHELPSDDKSKEDLENKIIHHNNESQTEHSKHGYIAHI